MLDLFFWKSFWKNTSPTTHSQTLKLFHNKLDTQLTMYQRVFLKKKIFKVDLILGQPHFLAKSTIKKFQLLKICHKQLETMWNMSIYFFLDKEKTLGKRSERSFFDQNSFLTPIANRGFSASKPLTQKTRLSSEHLSIFFLKKTNVFPVEYSSFIFWKKSKV